MRTLADRLAEMRAERGGPVPAPAALIGRPDRAEILARWFGARLQVAPDGAAVVVERRVSLPAGDGREPRRPATGLLLRHRDDRPLDRCRDGGLPGRPRPPGGRPARRPPAAPPRLPARGRPAAPGRRRPRRPAAGGHLQRPRLRPAAARHPPDRPPPLPGDGGAPRASTTTCCRWRGGCTGGRSAARGWPTWSSACSAWSATPTAPAARCRRATSATCAAARRTC